MKTVIHNKLIRDKIPEKIALYGDSCHISELSDDEYKKYLKFKLFEEMQEYCASSEVEELVDIIEVAYACANAHGVTNEKLDTMRSMKSFKYGKFDDRIFLVSTSSNDEETAIRTISTAVDKCLMSCGDNYADDIKNIKNKMIEYYKSADYENLDNMFYFLRMMSEFSIYLEDYTKKIFDTIQEQSKSWNDGMIVKPFPEDFDTLEGCPNSCEIDPEFKHVSFFNPDFNDQVHNYMNMVDGSKYHGKAWDNGSKDTK